MSWQEETIRDDAPMPPRIVVYGPGGIGKTTFGASMPASLIVDYDKGAGEVRGVQKHPGRSTWDASLALFREIAASPGGIRSLVVDTADVLEDQAEAAVCADLGCKSISDPKWGVGYEHLETKWRIMLAELDQIRAKGIIICILAHTATKTTHDPTVGEYEEYVSQLGKKTWAATYRWADFVGFVNFELGRAGDPGKDPTYRPLVTGNRVLYTQRGSGFQAKNRYRLEPRMTFSWNALIAGIQAHQVGQPVQAPAASPPPAQSIETAADIILRIESLCKAADARGLKTSDGRTFFDKGKEIVLGCKLDVAALRSVEAELRKTLGTSNGGTQQPQASA
jgi:hypothetical protein